MVSLDICLSASSFFLALYLYLRKRRSRGSLPLPPGPKGWPIIGNMLDMPTEFEWKTYNEWCKKYGTDILHVPVMGTNLIVLDSAEAVFDLMERRSSIYSDSMAGETIISVAYGLDIKPKDDPYIETAERGVHALTVAGVPGAFLVDMIPILKYVPEWMPGAGFQKKAKDWAKLTMTMLNVPFEAARERLAEGNVRHSVATYGLHMAEEGTTDEAYEESVVRATAGTLYAAGSDTVSTTLQKTITPLPLASTQIISLQTVSAISSCILALLENPEILKKAQAELDSIVEPGCLPDFKHENDLPYITAITLETLRWRDVVPIAVPRYLRADDEYKGYKLPKAGSDTTVSAISSCILALLENPEILKKAQAELDSIVEPGCLPDFKHENDLPYITAITLETLRWRDVVPIAVPRYLRADDEYKGYKLPKGSIVIPNAWAILHNETVYPDPFTFNPERFLTKDGNINKEIRDPRHACFGFGRRICPGRFMAYSTVWVAIASLIYCFDFKKAVDEDGNVIELSHEYHSALVVLPKPFKCSIAPRSEEHVKAIRSAIFEHEFSSD
ncbi:O-methylsterigmatocystin oxidoreductase [Leucoagaricus sp. SymC.cos]|nr:O-methylsterigmatocystin oxidoreductase [Leucoagaricus sp. SymC.cos]